MGEGESEAPAIEAGNGAFSDYSGAGCVHFDYADSNYCSTGFGDNMDIAQTRKWESRDMIVKYLDLLLGVSGQSQRSEYLLSHYAGRKMTIWNKLYFAEYHLLTVPGQASSDVLSSFLPVSRRETMHCY